MQLTADIFGMPTARPHTHETSGLGAAIDAAVGLGIHPDFALQPLYEEIRKITGYPSYQGER